MPQPKTTFLARLLRWRFLFIVNIVVLLFLGMTLGREYVRTHEIQKEINALETQAQQLSARNITLSELKTAVQTESFIEREARLKLGMKKPGEQVFIIQEAKTEEAQEGESGGLADGTDPLGFVLIPTDDHPQVANTTKWWYYFFNTSAYRDLRAYEN